MACSFAWARGLGESQRKKRSDEVQSHTCVFAESPGMWNFGELYRKPSVPINRLHPFPPPRFLVPPKHARCKIMNNFGKSYLQARSHSGFQPQRSFIKYISAVVCPKGEQIGTTFSCSSSRALYLITAAKRTPPVRLQKSQMSRQRTSIIRAVGRSRHGHNTTWNVHTRVADICGVDNLS